MLLHTELLISLLFHLLNIMMRSSPVFFDKNKKMLQHTELLIGTDELLIGTEELDRKQ